MESMGKRLKRLREKSGLTQSAVAKLIGVQRQAIHKYESGLVENMPRSSALKLAEAYGVSPAYVLSLDSMSEYDGTAGEMYSRLDDEDRKKIFVSMEKLLKAAKYKTLF